MVETYVVDVDIDLIRAHRSEHEQRDLSETEVRQWLVHRGFYPQIDGRYLAEAPVLELLDASEIIAAHPVPTIQ
jgi:hypothetical protein